MAKIMEKELSELQSKLISLCLELTESNVDFIYAYCCIEQNTKSFDAFFVQHYKIASHEELGITPQTSIQFTMLGLSDILQFETNCAESTHPIPTEIRMIYNVKTKEFKAHYEYSPRCSNVPGKTPHDVFNRWKSEVADFLNKKGK